MQALNREFCLFFLFLGPLFFPCVVACRGCFLSSKNGNLFFSCSVCLLLLFFVFFSFLLLPRLFLRRLLLRRLLLPRLLLPRLILPPLPRLFPFPRLLPLHRLLSLPRLLLPLLLIYFFLFFLVPRLFSLFSFDVVFIHSLLSQLFKVLSIKGRGGDRAGDPLPFWEG